MGGGGGVDSVRHRLRNLKYLTYVKQCSLCQNMIIHDIYFVFSQAQSRDSLLLISHIQ
jgi:hypothetical protein